MDGWLNGWVERRRTDGWKGRMRMGEWMDRKKD